MEDREANTSEAFADLLDISQGISGIPAYIFIYIIIFLFASVIGTFGNTMVIITTILSKSLRHNRNAFIISLAVADLMVAGISMPASITGVLMGKKWYEEKRALCTFTAIACAPGCIASMHSIAWIAISRFYYIAKIHVYHQYFTTSRVSLYISSIWLFSFLSHLPNHLGWGQIRYSFMLRYCATDTDLFSYAWFYALALVLAIVVAFLFYLKIYMVLRKSTLSKKLIVGNRQSNVSEQSSTALSDEIKIVRTSFKIFILFFITWLPLALLLLIHMGDKIPPWVYLYAALSAHGNSTLNFIMYFMENDQFRQALKEILRKMIRKPSPQVHDLSRMGNTFHQRTTVVNFVKRNNDIEITVNRAVC